MSGLGGNIGKQKEIYNWYFKINGADMKGHIQ